MRVVTYARVSTLKQSARGKSLVDQERAFALAVDRHGWHLVRAYAESASAKLHEGRAHFERMVDDLATTKPDVIVITTLDRFTRNLRLGLNEVEVLKGKGVALWVLDMETPRALDMDKDEDWRYVTAAFHRAEDENRERTRRINYSYAGRRDRDEVLANRPPFGLLIEGGRYVKDPLFETVWGEIHRRFIEGESLRELTRWLREACPEGATVRAGLRARLLNEGYVAAGLRTREQQTFIRQRLDHNSAFMVRKRKHEHEFAGVFRCARCERIMHGANRYTGARAAQSDALRCNRDALRNRHCQWFQAHLVRPTWLAILAEIDTDRWERSGFADGSAEDQRRRRMIERRLAETEQEEAALSARRNDALDLYRRLGAAAVAEVETVLVQIGADAKALETARQSLLGQLQERRTPVDVGEIREHVRALLREYADPDMPTGMRNRLNRLLVEKVGAFPVLGRADSGDVAITWAGIESHRKAAQPVG